MKTKKTQKKKTFKVKKQQKRSNSNEILGILIFAAGVLTFLSVYFTNTVGIFGSSIRNFLLGVLGVSGFVLPFIIIFWGFLKIFNRISQQTKIKFTYFSVLLILISALVETGNYNELMHANMTLGKSIKLFYESGNQMSFSEGIGGGVIGGLISRPFLLTLQPIGTIVVFTTLSLIVAILLTNTSVVDFITRFKAIFIELYRKIAIAVEKSRENTDEESLVEFACESNSVDNITLADSQTDAEIIDFKARKAMKSLKKQKQQPAEAGNVVDVAKNDERAIEFIMRDVGKQVTIKEIPTNNTSEQLAIECKPQPQEAYLYPPVTLLKEQPDEGKDVRNYKNAALEGAKKLEDTLASFGVAAKVINISRGPSVTRYELQPSTGVKVSRIVNLADDISLNLAASGVRIEAPIPGKAAIGIEVPNKEVMVVTLRDVIDSTEFSQHPSKLSFALGRDISGECIIGDIGKMPHLLIAGATGSGKSVCINSLIMSIIYKASPSEVKLLMVDPKVVELGIYNGIPHLLIPVVTDPKKAAGALNWAVQEMVNRYKLFADRSVRDLKGYNELLKQNGESETLPQIVIIIDELADLMMVAPNDVEDAICRLAQMARAAGMHLVIATQRPSVDVITGVIKANVPSRISFAVSSQIDSRTILDMAGAEKLLGRGDMLFYPVGKPKPLRVQGAFVSDEEVERVVEFIKQNASANYDDNIIEKINSEDAPVQNEQQDNDELLPRAIELVVESGQASVSLIQRKFKVGYARAARIVDQMEARGIVGGYEGSKPRQILVTRQQLHEMQMASDK